jgi:hypothetical protein
MLGYRQLYYYYEEEEEEEEEEGEGKCYRIINNIYNIIIK